MQNPQLVRGFFLRRDNRFRATVIVDGQEAWAHVPHSGRLTNLFVPDRSVWLARATNPARKTSYDMKLVELSSCLVSVDARLPHPLLAEAWRQADWPSLTIRRSSEKRRSGAAASLSVFPE